MKGIAKHFTALAVLFSSATAFAQVYTCGDNNGWSISNSIEFVHENGEYKYSIDFYSENSATIYISSNKIDNDWGAYCAGCLVPVGATGDYVLGPGTQNLPIQQYGGNQCDIHYKFFFPGSYTIRINEAMTEMSVDYVAPEGGLGMYLAGDPNGWSLNDASKFNESYVDGKYTLSGVILDNPNWNQAFKITDSKWKKRLASREPITGFGTYTFDYIPDNEDYNAVFNQSIDQVKVTAVIASGNWQVTFEPVVTEITGSLYTTGDAIGAWSPADNPTFTETDGIYSYEYTKNGIFKISTKEGDWNDFTTGLIVPEEGAPGVLDDEAEPFAVKIHHYGYDPGNYAIANYPGKYTVNVDKNNMKMWVNFEHDTDLQFHLKGDFNDWEGSELSTNIEDGAYVMESLFTELKTKEGTGNALKISTHNSTHHYTCATPIDNFGTYTFTYTADENDNAVLARDFDNVAVSAKLHKDEPETMYVTLKDTTTGIDAVTDASAVEEYYTVSGVRVSRDNLTPGLYISRCGNTAKKVIIK